jgi:hypothetical protein
MPDGGCRTLFKYGREKFNLQLAQAREGLYDPSRHIHRAKAVSEFPEGTE